MQPFRLGQPQGYRRVIVPGDDSILGVADKVMPDSLIERVDWVEELVGERRWYPIDK